MQKELDMWKEENKEHQLALKREQRFEDLYIYITISSQLSAQVLTRM